MRDRVDEGSDRGGACLHVQPEDNEGLQGLVHQHERCPECGRENSRTLNALVPRRVNLNKNRALMDYAMPEEEEQHRRITQEIIDLSKKLEPYEAEMRILYKARTNLYERWKGRYKYEKRK